MRIAVADDSPRDLQKIKTILEQYQENEKVRLDVSYFENGQNLWGEASYDRAYEVYLLDVEMPKMDGIEVAKRLRECDRNAYLIFITSHVGYAPSATEYGVFRYIEKDNLQERLPQAIRAVIEDMRRQYKQQKYYYIMDAWSQERIDYLDIVHADKKGKYTVFTKRDGTCTRVRKTLEQVVEELNSDDFVYISRGQVVNLNHVERIEGGMVYMINHIALEAGKTRVTELRKQLTKFWGK